MRWYIDPASGETPPRKGVVDVPKANERQAQGTVFTAQQSVVVGNERRGLLRGKTIPTITNPATTRSAQLPTSSYESTAVVRACWRGASQLAGRLS
jgi:hypothetical protein